MRHECGGHLECVVAAGGRRAALFGATRRLDEGLVGRAWRRGETVLVDDADAAGSAHRWGEPMQVCVLPIHIDGELAGAISVCSGRDEPDLRGDVPLLERISGLATIALANTQLVEASAVALKRTRALAEVSRLLATVQDTTEASDRICRLLLSATDISRASCYLVDVDGRLAPQGAWGRSDGEVRRERTLPPELVRESLAQWCVDHARVAEAPSGRDDPRESARVHAAKARLGIGSACAMPILERGPRGRCAARLARSRPCRPGRGDDRAVPCGDRAALDGARAKPALECPPPPGLPRQPDRPCRTVSASRASWSRPSRAHGPTPTRSPCCSSISTASRASTTRSVTRWEIGC